MKKIVNTSSTDHEAVRKLSPWRVLFVILILSVLGYGSVFGWSWWKDTQVAAKHDPWFAAYVDVTSTPTYQFEQLGSTSTKNAILSFIVSSPDDPCIPTWGGAYTLDEANSNLDLDRRIARLQQQGGNIAISFGGLLNDEIALKCKDTDRLLKAYQLVIDRYKVDTIDLDLENSGLTDLEAAKRRSEVIAELQSLYRSNGKSLAVWVTLPVAPQGLTEDGTNAVEALLKGGVDLAGLNVMTMNYSSSREEGQTMHEASQEALKQAHRQLGILYQKAGVDLNSTTLWTKIGATPMIGQNDVPEEVFTTEDAKKLNLFAQSNGIGRMSMWSVNRDVPCGENYVDTKVVSDSCSGVNSEKFSYSIALSQGFDGNLKQNASIVTTEDSDAKNIEPDDPEKSPYQIWKESGAYLAGTKVVWRRNVYEAKWWTQGDIPDNPVLQSWQTPWQLIGPVLPNEKPIQQPTLPRGTYPNWSGSVEYETGDRVLFNEIPYQAKWWNQGESPAAASSNADSSPWAPLTQAQIKEIIESQEK